jgi:hypothetical protein
MEFGGLVLVEATASMPTFPRYASFVDGNAVTESKVKLRIFVAFLDELLNLPESAPLLTARKLLRGQIPVIATIHSGQDVVEFVQMHVFPQPNLTKDAVLAPRLLPILDLTTPR